MQLLPEKGSSNMLLQDWTTVAGSTASITQSRRGWADLAGASNVTFWLEVRDVVSDQGNVRITYETAPADEDALFEPIGSVTLKLTSSAIVTKVRLGNDQTKALGRFVRWRIDGDGHWTATFRVFVLPTTSLEGPAGVSGDTSGFRLSLSSGAPVATADVTGTTIYLTPYRHANIVLYDGAKWRSFTTNEISLVPTLLANKNLDVFAYYDATTSTVKLEASANWSSDTARTDAVSRKDGIFVKTSDPTRRLMGTLRTNSNATFEDSVLRRFVWNADNRLDRPMLVTESTASWLYSSSSWRAANGNSANSLAYVDGAGEELVKATAIGRANTPGGTIQVGYVGIGLDSSTAVAAQLRGSDSDATSALQRQAHYRGYPGIGLHTLYWIERSNGTVNVLFAGSPGAEYQFGMFAAVKA